MPSEGEEGCSMQQERGSALSELGILGDVAGDLHDVTHPHPARYGLYLLEHHRVVGGPTVSFAPRSHLQPAPQLLGILHECPI